MTERMQKLTQMLEKSPNDPFLAYGLAMEHKNAGDNPRAVEWFGRVIQLDPGYCYAYHQRGLAHEAAGDLEAARQSYRQGIEAARGKGDHHAAGEIAASLAMIE